MTIKYDTINNQYRPTFYEGDKLDISATVLSHLEFFLTVVLPAYVKYDVPRIARRFYNSLSREQAITGIVLLVLIGMAVGNKLMGL